MTVPMPYIPPNVYLLADNLDAALAAGEDLMKAELVWETGAGRDGADIARARAAQRSVLEKVRSLEQILVARVLKSRERSEEIAKRDPRFATVARLYNAGTAILIEAVADFGNIATADFESGGGAVPFLRARGLLADDSPGPTEGETFKFRDDFLVAGRIRLGTLLDLIAMYLDTLEIHYDLFDEVLVEPDLLPGETDPDRIESAPVQAAADSGEPDALDDEADSEEVEALRKALLEVRSAVALDQR
ncbi:MAG TPA: hypothetical protein VFX71_02720 [Hyphomicrobium sp.]|nr:hypothetical protein [Hyphomicrobium sp.]